MLSVDCGLTCDVYLLSIESALATNLSSEQTIAIAIKLSVIHADFNQFHGL